jgi:hypothetical protein
LNGEVTSIDDCVDMVCTRYPEIAPAFRIQVTVH